MIGFLSLTFKCSKYFNIFNFFTSLLKSTDALTFLLKSQNNSSHHAFRSSRARRKRTKIFPQIKISLPIHKMKRKEVEWK